ncbi:hypothetical protein [Streptomyces sp. NPDC001480]|uniref:hypothetical protein n=1 Tax=Streptomyces sp. NPDC001480 TaxID=3364577 RepID=UPI0036CEB0C5
MSQLMEAFEVTHGYPAGDNEVALADDETRAAVTLLTNHRSEYAALLSLFAVIDSVSLPDIGNGYFIHPPSTVTAHLDEYGAVPLENGDHGIVFGSDGGGSLFALAVNGTVPAAVRGWFDRGGLERQQTGQAPGLPGGQRQGRAGCRGGRGECPGKTRPMAGGRLWGARRVTLMVRPQRLVISWHLPAGRLAHELNRVLVRGAPPTRVRAGGPGRCRLSVLAPSVRPRSRLSGCGSPADAVRHRADLPLSVECGD